MDTGLRRYDGWLGGGCDGMVIKDGCGGFGIAGLAAITGITTRMSPCPRHSGAGQNPFTAELMSRTAVRVWVPACAGMTAERFEVGAVVNHG